MSYIDGFVLAVPATNRQAYIDHATASVPLFKEFGATRMVETWGDDVPDGKVTDFRRAVKATDDEVVLFSWMEYPDKATRDAAMEKIMSDPRMAEMGAGMPFDGTRMIFAGFAPIVEAGAGGAMGYADGYLVPVPLANKDAYRALAEKAATVFQDHGATRVVECWGEGLPDGKTTDFKQAVQAQPHEAVVFSYVEWPSKEARQQGWGKVMADERMQPDGSDMPFDGKRMVYGGFTPILDA
ncbi:hypothetical protein ASG11_16060 [Sphingomonas sp. Leaf357]|uniref:DUF1428 domain-containing protein n=1 Tax=Sphingomonas sp. Leaf357 TaxID=1736350 RepID=UPI0006F3DDF6|nr:hypothetical protein ASG11_16060 [Sphingomonas sp. Leaf357]